MKIPNLTKLSLAVAIRDAIYDAAEPPTVREPAILAGKRGFIYASKSSYLGRVAIDLERGLGELGITSPVKEVSQGEAHVRNLSHAIVRGFYEDVLQRLEQTEKDHLQALDLE